MRRAGVLARRMSPKCSGKRRKRKRPMAVSDVRLARRPIIHAYSVAGILAALVQVVIIAIGGGVFLAALSVLFVLVAILIRRLPRLAGPVFFYDLIRTTRRGHST